ncbi:unnamed protein product [Pleuronectes platessa]|uniref:Uncharacterized protein n=1 Tax=Pleuronectes platessa TaxID=8262 RepID=A0A9N7TJM7_PLEPL|nr:unnamed protein product [Pleuronectes platessa]
MNGKPPNTLDYTGAQIQTPPLLLNPTGKVSDKQTACEFSPPTSHKFSVFRPDRAAAGLRGIEHNEHAVARHADPLTSDTSRETFFTVTKSPHKQLILSGPVDRAGTRARSQQGRHGNTTGSRREPVEKI